MITMLLHKTLFILALSPTVNKQIEYFSRVVSLYLLKNPESQQIYGVIKISTITMLIMI